VLAVVLGGAVAPLALAHAVLLGAEPSENAIVESAPKQVRLFFSEPIDPELFALEVYDANQHRADLGDAHVTSEDRATLQTSLPDLPDGTYVVVWRVLSPDSHVANGAHRFSVGAGVVPAAVTLDLPEPGVPFALEAAVRWLTFLSSFVLVGGLAFRTLVAAKAGVPARAARRAQRVWLTVAWIALATLGALTILALLVQAASAGGLPLVGVLGSRALPRVLGRVFGLGRWVTERARR